MITINLPISNDPNTGLQRRVSTGSMIISDFSSSENYVTARFQLEFKNTSNQWKPFINTTGVQPLPFWDITTQGLYITPDGFRTRESGYTNNENVFVPYGTLYNYWMNYPLDRQLDNVGLNFSMMAKSAIGELTTIQQLTNILIIIAADTSAGNYFDVPI